MNAGRPWWALATPGAVWAFDVDGTLIGSVRSDVLRPGALALLDELTRRHVTCVLWSAGGDDYATRTAAAHGFDRAIVAYYGKHRRDPGGRYGIDHFATVHRPHVFVDDAPDDLPADATVVAVPQFLGGNPADRALWAVLERLGSPGRTTP